MRDIAKVSNKQALRCTWVELLVLFQAQTGVRLQNDALDLKSQEKVFKTMCQRILKQAKYWQDGQCSNFAEVWGPAATISSAKPVIGHARAGILRRPAVPNNLWAEVVRVMQSAMMQGNNVVTFGQGYKTHIKAVGDSTYEAEAIIRMREAFSTKQVQGAVCDIEKRAVVAGGKPCHSVTEGPCYFGHSTTSGRRGGRVSWYRNPEISFWIGKVPGLVPLCSRCYQSGNRARAKNRIPKLPKFETTEGFIGCPAPGTTIQECANVGACTAVLINNPPALGDCVVVLGPLVRQC